MPRKYNSRAKRKRDEAFLKNLARRENPIRYLVCLPVDVSDLDALAGKPRARESCLSACGQLKQLGNAKILSGTVDVQPK
jgi:hypothetical protein